MHAKQKMFIRLEGFWSERVSEPPLKPSGGTLSHSFEQTFALPYLLRSTELGRFVEIENQLFFAILWLKTLRKELKFYYQESNLNLNPTFRRASRTRRPTPRRRRTTPGTTESLRSLSTPLRKWWARAGNRHREIITADKTGARRMRYSCAILRLG